MSEFQLILYYPLQLQYSRSLLCGTGDATGSYGTASRTFLMWRRSAASSSGRKRLSRGRWATNARVGRQSSSVPCPSWRS